VKTLHLDCSAGVSGDMILGALADLGVDMSDLAARLRHALKVEFALECETVTDCGIAARHIRIVLPEQDHEHDHHDHLSYTEIRDLVASGDLPERARQRSLDVLLRIAEAEATVHGTSVDEVHFHELGGIDTVVDICGAMLALEELGIDRCTASRLPISHGFVRCAHGTLPVPAPAVMELLKGLPVFDLDVEGETVTPTGAGIVRGLCETIGRLPEMTLERVGYGAGTRRGKTVPNVVRVFLGTTGADTPAESVIEIQANVDDTTPEVCGYLVERLLTAGALDVFFIPIQMKKNRPATMVTVLSSPELAQDLVQVIFEETTTLGVRMGTLSRQVLPRTTHRVPVGGGEVRIKVAHLPDGSERAAPEFDDCAELARRVRKPLLAIQQEALRAYQESAED